MFTEKTKSLDTKEEKQKRIPYSLLIDKHFFDQIDKKVAFIKANENYSASKQSLIYCAIKKLVEELENDPQIKDEEMDDNVQLKKIQIQLDKKLIRRIEVLLNVLRRKRGVITKKDFFIEAIIKYVIQQK